MPLELLQCLGNLLLIFLLISCPSIRFLRLSYQVKGSQKHLALKLLAYVLELSKGHAKVFEVVKLELVVLLV